MNIMSGFEVRFEKQLRQEIQEAMGAYIDELDSVDAARPNALVQFVQARERYSTFEEVLLMMDTLVEKLAEA